MAAVDQKLPGMPDGIPELPAGLDFIRVLGYGATGFVVLARQASLNRLVAVKTIGSSPAADTVRRLDREARILASLAHPSILPVYFLRNTGAHLFLVMEYLPGGDLTDQLGRNLLDYPRKLQVLFDVADALRHASAAGVTHRDLKPSNILFRHDGRAVLGDFGLARMSLRTNDFKTVSGMITGTPRYLAPEQSLHPDSADPRIDSYSFGVLAYQLVTGQWPYHASTLAGILQAHVSSQPTPPNNFDPNIPAKVCRALLRALEKDPTLRATPDALCTALGRNCTDPGIGVATFGVADRGRHQLPPGPAGSTPSDTVEHWIQPPIYLAPHRSRRRAIAGITVGVLLVLVLTVYLLWLR